jgi:hypothetical protein
MGVNAGWQAANSAKQDCDEGVAATQSTTFGVFMRKTMLALAAATLTVPTMPSVAVARDGYYNGKVWRDSHGRLRCKRSNGTTGVIVGAAGGALLGRAIDTHGERATGTILGAAAGALVGRSIDRNRSRYRCR